MDMLLHKIMRATKRKKMDQLKKKVMHEMGKKQTKNIASCINAFSLP